MKPLSLRETALRTFSGCQQANDVSAGGAVFYLCSWLAMQFTATVLPSTHRAGFKRAGDSAFSSFSLSPCRRRRSQLDALLGLGRKRKRQSQEIRLLCGHDLLAACGSAQIFPPARRCENHFLMAVIAGFATSSLLSYPQRHAARRVIECGRLHEPDADAKGIYYGFAFSFKKRRWLSGPSLSGKCSPSRVTSRSGPGEALPEQPHNALLAAIRLAVGPAARGGASLSACF